jgi:hypothetical protein
LVCTDIGGEQGECQTSGGLVDSYCNGVLRVDGEGVALCATNADCAAIGAPFGMCTLSATRRCFLDPIDVSGNADQTEPLLVTTTCIAPTANAGVNAASGLPGPARLSRGYAVSIP